MGGPGSPKSSSHDLVLIEGYWRHIEGNWWLWGSHDYWRQLVTVGFPWLKKPTFSHYYQLLTTIKNPTINHCLTISSMAPWKTRATTGHFPDFWTLTSLPRPPCGFPRSAKYFRIVRPYAKRTSPEIKAMVKHDETMIFYKLMFVWRISWKLSQLIQVNCGHFGFGNGGFTPCPNHTDLGLESGRKNHGQTPGFGISRTLSPRDCFDFSYSIGTFWKIQAIGNFNSFRSSEWISGVTIRRNFMDFSASKFRLEILDPAGGLLVLVPPAYWIYRKRSTCTQQKWSEQMPDIA